MSRMPCAVTADLNRYMRQQDEAEAYASWCERRHDAEMATRGSPYRWRWIAAEFRARKIRELRSAGQPIPPRLWDEEHKLRAWCENYLLRLAQEDEE